MQQSAGTLSILFFRLFDHVGDVLQGDEGGSVHLMHDGFQFVDLEPVDDKVKDLLVFLLISPDGFNDRPAGLESF